MAELLIFPMLVYYIILVVSSAVHSATIIFLLPIKIADFLT